MVKSGRTNQPQKRRREEGKPEEPHAHICTLPLVAEARGLKKLHKDENRAKTIKKPHKTCNEVQRSLHRAEDCNCINL